MILYNVHEIYISNIAVVSRYHDVADEPGGTGFIPASERAGVDLILDYSSRLILKVWYSLIK